MQVRESDYGYDINFTVLEDDGETIRNISGTTIKFQVCDIITRLNIIDGNCSIINAANGTCKYTVGANDFNKAGNFEGGLKITSSGGIITTKDIPITVLKKWK